MYVCMYMCLVKCMLYCTRKMIVYVYPCNHAADEGVMGEAGPMEYQDGEPEPPAQQRNLQPGTCV